MAGAQVTVFSFAPVPESEAEGIQIKPPGRQMGDYRYLSYRFGGRALRKAMDERGVEVVNALNLTPFGVWALQAGKRPLIASALGADVLEYPPKLDLSPVLAARSWDNVEGGAAHHRYGWKRRLHRRQVGRVLKGADLVTGDNQTLLDAMGDWFGVPASKMKLLRWGVEPELFEANETRQNEIRRKFGITPGQTVIFSPRGAKAIYQGDIIIEAFEKLLVAGHTDCRFIMLGVGYEVANKVENLAWKLEEQYPNFQFVREQLPREEVSLLWKEVDVFVSAPVYDGYSAALAEGRYVGAVPVVNDIPATRELVQHQQNAWFSEPFTVNQLASDLEEIIKELPRWKTAFAEKNQAWIRENSLMMSSAETFLGWCKVLKANE